MFNDWSTMKKLIWLRGSGIGGGATPQYETVTGKIVSFLTQRIAPLKIEADLEPIQSGSGDPSPDNVRPITGHAGVDVWDDPAYGGNIMWNQMFETTVTAEWDGITTEYDSTTNAIKITNNSRTTNYGTGSSRNSLILGDDLVIGHKYLQVFYPETDGVIAVRTGNVALPTIFTCEYQQNVILRITRDYKFTTDHPVGDVTSVWFNFYDLTEMFGEGNEPSTVEEFKALFPKDYYAYNSGTETCVSAVNGDPYEHVTITFGSTVYGGTLTVNEDGTGTVKARPYYASYNGETLVGPWVSSEDAYAPGTTPTTGAQVVDMGGTETTISLTPGQVNALQGNNTVWVDESGEIKVTYQIN